jgi:hypothetical protein
MNDIDINSWASDVERPVSPPPSLQLEPSPQAVEKLPVSFLQSLQPSSSTLSLDEDTIPESPPSSPASSESFVKSGAPLVSVGDFTADTDDNYAVR